MLPKNIKSNYLPVNLMLLDVKKLTTKDVSFVVHAPSKFYQTPDSVCYPQVKPISKIINFENEQTSI
jgi:hypothetical protein